MTKKVTAVIPAYNNLDLLKKNLSSVIACLRPDDELIIIDDASSDNTADFVNLLVSSEKKISIRLIKNQENLRFGASCNKAVKQAKNELILLLNSDVLPKKDILSYLIGYFDNKDTFGVGILQIEKDGSKSGKNKLWFEKGMFIHSKVNDLSSGSTAWVSGGAGLFDKEKWLELKGFDESYYPAYWEDVDLSFRARKRGWKVLFEEKAVVNHFHETTNQTVFGQKQIDKISWQNAKKFVLNNGDIWQKIAFFLWRPYWWWKLLSK